MGYSEFLELITQNTSNELDNYEKLCRICITNHTNGVDISDSGCSSIKRIEAIQSNYITITKQYLPTSNGYPKFVCAACEMNLSQFATFVQQIEQNAENWEMFLAHGQPNKRTVVFKDCDEDYKPFTTNETIEIKIEFCDEKYDTVPDTDENIHDALDVPHLKSEQIHTILLNDVPATAKRKRKTTEKSTTFMNMTTDFERTCKHCDVPTFKSLARLYSHQKLLHPGTKNFNCDQCGASFISKTAMATHMKERHANCGRKHQCQFCAKLFFSDREVRGHEKSHLNERSYVCSLCGKGFNQKTRLNIHLRSKAHNVNYQTIKHKRYPRSEKQVYRRVYRCEQCVPATIYASAEERTHHRDLVHKIYDCEICKNSFLTIESLHSHKLLHSKDKPRPHVCSVCNATFNQASHLASHIKCKHTEHRAYQCSFCDKTFSENFNLTSHVKLVHRKGERARCSECPAHFSSAKYLQRHMQERHSAKPSPYDCKDCGMKNNSGQKLALHRLKFHKP